MCDTSNQRKIENQTLMKERSVFQAASAESWIWLWIKVRTLANSAWRPATGSCRGGAIMTGYFDPHMAPAAAGFFEKQSSPGPDRGAGLAVSGTGVLRESRLRRRWALGCSLRSLGDWKTRLACAAGGATALAAEEGAGAPRLLHTSPTARSRPIADDPRRHREAQQQRAASSLSSEICGERASMAGRSGAAHVFRAW